MDLGDNSVFSFCICTDNQNNICSGLRLEMGSYSVFLSPNTEYDFREKDDTFVLIIGVATCMCEDVDAMEWLWKNRQSIETVINAEYYLGGKYILFVCIKDQYFIMGDATGSLPIFYSFNGKELLCSSLSFQMAEHLHLNPDETLVNIRQSGDDSATMPYDYTIWKEIKRLLPNHYLDCNQRKPIRFVNHTSCKKSISAEEVVEVTMPYMKRLAQYYQEKYSVACALTSGRDSRAVLAILGCEKDLPVYTMKHAEFTNSTPDVSLPLKIADKVCLNYSQITDVSLTEKDVSYANTYLGKDNYKMRTLMLAHTINHHYGNNAVINGDIIGQVGKCSLHRDIPERFAIPSYFLCKLHNYSKEAKFALGEWLEEIKDVGEHVNKFDLFSIENRLGVWAANENEIYNLLGQYYLNIFNSRSIIYEWTRVSRRERKNSSIHLAIIRALNPVLLEIPFEASGLLEKISKYNGYTYLCASYLKHYIEKIKSRL